MNTPTHVYVVIVRTAYRLYKAETKAFVSLKAATNYKVTLEKLGHYDYIDIVHAEIR